MDCRENIIKTPFFMFRLIGRHADDFPPTYDFTIGRGRGRPPARDIVAIWLELLMLLRLETKNGVTAMGSRVYARGAFARSRFPPILSPCVSRCHPYCS